MKIAFLMQDEHLEDEFVKRKIHKDDELQFYDHPEAMMEAQEKQSWDVLVVSDRFFDLPGLCEFAEALKERLLHGKMAVMLSNRHDALKNEKFVKYCLSNGYFYTPAGQTVSSIVQGIYGLIYGQDTADRSERKKMVLFVGSTPNIGTTLVSFGTAVRLAKETNQSIAYLCLNLKSSKIHKYLGIDEPATTLDGIRAELKSQGITKERFIQYCDKVKDIPNLYVLYGNMLREQAEFFTPEDMEYLLQLASNCFDLCIVEVNAYWDNAATICGMLYADTKIVVTSKEIAHFQEDVHRWIKSVSPVFGINESSFDLFITQQEKSLGSSGISIRDVRRETSMNVVGEMGKHPQIIEYLNRGKIVDLFTSYPPMISDLSGLVNTLITLYTLNRSPQNMKKPWFGRLVSKTSVT